MALSSRKIRLPPVKKPSTRRSRGRVRSMTTIGISPRAPCNWRRSRSAPMIVSTNPIIVNPGVTMYVKMPTYGFENVAIASSRNNRKNENRLPMTMTSPVRLSQLRSSEGCWPEGVGLSALMVEFLCCQSKKICRKGRLPCAGSRPLGQFYMGSDRNSRLSGRPSLLLERPHVSDERLDVVVRHALGRLHEGLAVFVFQTFLDGLDRRVILQIGLHLGVGIILHAKFLAHLGLSLAVRAVAFGAVAFVVGFGVRRAGGQSRNRDDRDAECE